MSVARIRAFCATSLDGFLAGEGDDLSWLPESAPGEGDHGFAAFLAQMGAMLMGRRTYDVVVGFDLPWPYGDLPVLVATHRTLDRPAATVRAVSGDIGSMVEEARTAAGGRDVYIDGGELLREALDAGLLDEVTVTLVPIVLGRGLPLFAGATGRHRLVLHSESAHPRGLVQLTYGVVR
jgi:dihydrofolate reductase